MGTLAVVFAVATGANIAMDIKQQKKIEKAQEKQANVDRANKGEEAARARRTTIREAMTKRAQVENIAGAAGQTGSSAAIAGVQQITGDASENIGSINTSLSLSNLQTQAQQNLFNAQRTSPLRLIGGAVQQGAVSGIFK